MIDPELDLTVVDRVVSGIGRTPDKVIPILQALQAECRWLPGLESPINSHHSDSPFLRTIRTSRR